MKELFKSWKDIEIIMENCPNNFSYGTYLQVAIEFNQI